jgi:MoaA/NifB/PqqE/SkfB family radical SAM enzyme
MFGEEQDKWFKKIFVYITEECQLSCKHCYLGSRLRKPNQMTSDEIVNLLMTWKELGATKVNFLGGEPTLHPSLNKVIYTAHTLGYEEISITTNGISSSLRNPTNYFSQESLSCLSHIQVSLDGASPQVHNAIRGKNTYQYVVSTIQALVDLDFDVRIVSTVNKINLDDILDIIPMAHQWGVRLVKFHVFSQEGNGILNDYMVLSPREWIQFTDHIQRISPPKDLVISFQPTYSRENDLQEWKRKGYGGCIGRQLSRVSVFPNGRLFICSYLFDTNLEFARYVKGNIHLNLPKSELNLFSAGSSIACPADKGLFSCRHIFEEAKIIPICRLWKFEV